jgi:hypothetical protein
MQTENDHPFGTHPIFAKQNDDDEGGKGWDNPGPSWSNDREVNDWVRKEEERKREQEDHDSHRHDSNRPGDCDC